MRWLALALMCSVELVQSQVAADQSVLPVRTIGPTVGFRSDSKGNGSPGTTWVDSLQLVTQVYSAVNQAVAFGDTDHDGHNEIIMAVNLGPTFNYRILEEQGNNTYVEVFAGPYIDPSAAGDVDRDGKADIVAQAGNRLVVYESPSPSTHPSVLAWQSPPLTNILGGPTIADTDGDGWLEIIHSINTFGTSRLVIYENTGDNTYSQVYYQLESPQDAGPRVIADLDGDGRLEIAHCGTYGYVHIYESPANNVWQQTFFDSTGLDNAYAVAGGVDTDGNGKPEIFVTGDSQEVPGERRTFVYEAVGDNSFARVAVLRYYDAHRGGAFSCVANLDGIGRDELVLAVYPDLPTLLIYRAVAPGQWVIASTFVNPDPDGGGIPMAFDANGNGRDEIFWVGSGNANFGTTWVLEHTPVSPTDLPLDLGPTQERLFAFPNPCRTKASLVFGKRGRTLGATLATFDASGRFIARTPVRGDRPDWSPAQLQPGVYFLRLGACPSNPRFQGRQTG